ncbi:unnamed protein product [Protopolystoma xenopodis]|uniref:Uncharacterized protein n=1 Tax=Protopolystoma xenopodis TaxID=117903 RepID=A0A3S5CMK8_9PLAT|nr:unnamed protein product [Protopolystoma xenopodis]
MFVGDKRLVAIVTRCHAHFQNGTARLQLSSFLETVKVLIIPTEPGFEESISDLLRHNLSPPKQIWLPPICQLVLLEAEEGLAAVEWLPRLTILLSRGIHDRIQSVPLHSEKQSFWKKRNLATLSRGLSTKVSSTAPSVTEVMIISIMGRLIRKITRHFTDNVYDFRHASSAKVE